MLNQMYNIGYRAPVLEQQYLLRVKPEMATQIRNLLKLNKTKIGLEVKFSPDEQGENKKVQFNMANQNFTGGVYDLPCIMETHKTVDNMNYYKSGDIGQMIVIHDDNDPPATDSSSLKNGITPATANIRRRNWKKKKTKEEVEEIETEIVQTIRNHQATDFEIIYDDEDFNNYPQQMETKIITPIQPKIVPPVKPKITIPAQPKIQVKQPKITIPAQPKVVQPTQPPIKKIRIANTNINTNINSNINTNINTNASNLPLNPTKIKVKKEKKQKKEKKREKKLKKKHRKRKHAENPTDENDTKKQKIEASTDISIPVNTIPNPVNSVRLSATKIRFTMPVKREPIENQTQTNQPQISVTNPHQIPQTNQPVTNQPQTNPPQIPVTNPPQISVTNQPQISVVNQTQTNPPQIPQTNQPPIPVVNQLPNTMPITIKRETIQNQTQTNPPQISVTNQPQIPVTNPPQISVTNQPQTNPPQIPQTNQPQIPVTNPPQIPQTNQPQIPVVNQPEVQEKIGEPQIEQIKVEEPKLDPEKIQQLTVQRKKLMADKQNITNQINQQSEKVQKAPNPVMKERMITKLDDLKNQEKEIDLQIEEISKQL